MKRAAFLHCVDLGPKRFDVLQQRDQVPVDVVGPDYTLNASFQMRFMLDLIGGESETLGGLPPSVAAPMVENIVGRFPWHPLNAAASGTELWGGVVVFDESGGDPTRFTGWFAGELHELPGWIAGVSAQNVADYGRPLKVARIFLANASRAAAFVRQRAIELGLPEGEDFSEVNQ